MGSLTFDLQEASNIPPKTCIINNMLCLSHKLAILCLKLIGMTTLSIQQGLGLLDAMNEVYSQRKWRMECFDDECKKWLLLLLRLVDYEQNPEIMLHEFISSKHYVCGTETPKSYH